MENVRLKQDIITDTVRNWIFSGKYQPGDKLPADTQLAVMFGVNKCTIAAGLNKLVDENVLERAPKRGTIVRKKNDLFQTNAVPLIFNAVGEVYYDFSRYVDSRLKKKNLFPMLIDHNLASHISDIESFLTRIVSGSKPFGYLIVGTRDIPYEMLKNDPVRFQNLVFLLWYENPQKLPGMKFVGSDYEYLAQQAMEYFRERGVERLLYPALYEPKFEGDITSCQVKILRHFKEMADQYGIVVDDGLFWRSHAGAKISDILPQYLENSSLKTGFFAWTDAVYELFVKDTVAAMGKDLFKDYVCLGNFNTAYAKKYHIDSFDPCVDEVAKIAVDMLTGDCVEQEKLIRPKLVYHSRKKEK